MNPTTSPLYFATYDSPRRAHRRQKAFVNGSKSGSVSPLRLAISLSLKEHSSKRECGRLYDRHLKRKSNIVCTANTASFSSSAVHCAQALGDVDDSDVRVWVRIVLGGKYPMMFASSP